MKQNTEPLFEFDRKINQDPEIVNLESLDLYGKYSVIKLICDFSNAEFKTSI
jgi:hypothetical protein